MSIEISKFGKLAAAPMVDQSELPFRLLCRKYGATVCFTPMMHAALFVKDSTYRKENLTISPNDRPLVVQFCANDPDIFAEASKMVESIADAVDLNLGCPQGIARKGHYGAFLQDEWSLIEEMVKKTSQQIKIPVSCKIRIFPSLEKTISYAKMLVKAGASMLTVHGRTREQKGALTGLADWNVIASVKAAVDVPVYANGNIQFISNVQECIQATNADGIMSAEGILYNPALFSGKHVPVWVLATEYLDLYDLHPTSFAHAKAHMFKLLHHLLQLEENITFREAITNTSYVEDFRPIIEEIKIKYTNSDATNSYTDSCYEMEMTTLPVPVYLSQPHFRKDRLDQKYHFHDENSEKKKRPFDQLIEVEGSEDMSKNMLRKILKKKRKEAKEPNKVKQEKNRLEPCVICSNPRGLTCNWQLCKPCCKLKRASNQSIICDNHSRRIKYKVQSLNETDVIEESNSLEES